MFKINFLKIFTLGLSLAVPLSATCPREANTLFMCQTVKKNKMIEVCDNNGTIIYNYGKNIDNPEVSINVDDTKVSTYQWENVGRHEFYTIDIPSDNEVYSVFWSMDTKSKDKKIDAGVDIEHDDSKYTTILNCTQDSIFNSLMGYESQKDKMRKQKAQGE
ncbi:MAG: hypothetical protein FNT15_06125 [Sulfurovum sp.]|nr:MAG: hypothetical protein FNT15_06125 [Sulfurovum sp.]